MAARITETLLMCRFHLRTLLIMLTVGPPVIATGYARYQAWRRSNVEQYCVGEGGFMRIYEYQDGQWRVVSEIDLNPGMRFELKRN